MLLLVFCSYQHEGDFLYYLRNVGFFLIHITSLISHWVILNIPNYTVLLVVQPAPTGHLSTLFHLHVWVFSHVWVHGYVWVSTHVWVHGYVWVSTHMWVHVHMDACACGGQKSTLCISLALLPPVYWGRAPQYPEFSDWANLASQLALGNHQSLPLEH